MNRFPRYYSLSSDCQMAAYNVTLSFEAGLPATPLEMKLASKTRSKEKGNALVKIYQDSSSTETEVTGDHVNITADTPNPVEQSKDHI